MITEYEDQHSGSESGERRRPDGAAQPDRSEIDWPPAVQLEAHVAQIIAEDARIGKFIDVYLLEHVDFPFTSEAAIEIADTTRKVYRQQILLFDEDALPHLCLPISYQSELNTAGVVLIPTLRALVRTGLFERITNIDAPKAALIGAALDQWEHIPNSAQSVTLM